MATSNVEEFQPSIEWDHDQRFDTLLVFLPGLEKDDLTIQLTSSRKLRVTGERQNAEKWSQIYTEISIPSNLDSDKVSARFDNGILYVKFPKVIVPAEPHPKPPTTAPEAPVPISESPSEKKDQKTDAPTKVEKPDKSKHGDEKQDKEGSRQKRIEEENKPEGAEEPNEGKKPDDDAQKRAAEKEKKLRENATNISETGPSGKDMKFPGGFLARMEQPKNLINSIVAVLLVLMLGTILNMHSDLL